MCNGHAHSDSVERLACIRLTVVEHACLCQVPEQRNPPKAGFSASNYYMYLDLPSPKNFNLYCVLATILSCAMTATISSHSLQPAPHYSKTYFLLLKKEDCTMSSLSSMEEDVK